MVDISGVAVNMQRTEQDNYYTFFDAHTNHGVVMNIDFSSVTQRTITTDEERARNVYADILVQIEQHYRNYQRPQIETIDDILSQRIVATSLMTEHVSSRSTLTETRACRLYPPEIYEWSEFASLVNKFNIQDKVHDPGRFSTIFLFSITTAMRVRSNESGEQAILLLNLNNTLVQSRTVHYIQEGGPDGVQGRIDFALMKDSKTISIICETKSTQNLALPMTAELCVEKYNAAYKVMKDDRVRTTEWSNIAHPIGQLLGYMVDNACPFGALTSGTRTYFVYIADDVNVSDKEDIGKKVLITDAWFVGQHNYLRAWAYVYNLGCNVSDNDTWNLPKGWVKSMTEMGSSKLWGDKNAETPGDDGEFGKPSFTKKRRFDGPDNNEDDDNGTTMAANTSMRCGIELRRQNEELPRVSIDKIKIIDVIGFGRNGCCFKVNWNGQLYAMKQFDIGRDGDTNFKKELLAYMKLKKAWGILVPQPMFVSESVSGGRWFLGLQLGRQPTVVDDNTIRQFNNVLDRLQKEYGIQHNDAEGRNMIYITDADGIEKIVAIDFEDWKYVTYILQPSVEMRDLTASNHCCLTYRGRQKPHWYWYRPSASEYGIPGTRYREKSLLPIKNQLHGDCSCSSEDCGSDKEEEEDKQKMPENEEGGGEGNGLVTKKYRLDCRPDMNMDGDNDTMEQLLNQ